MRIFFRGGIIAEEKAALPVNDHGLLYGIGLFETFRTYGGQPFLLEQHLERMREGCRGFDIHPPAASLLGRSDAAEAVRHVVSRLLEENRMDDALFRFTVTAGAAPAGLPETPYENPAEIIHVRSLQAPLRAEGQRLYVLGTRRSSPEILPRPKSLQYANSIVGHRELRRIGAKAGDEGLMLTTDGKLAEGIVSNIFLLLDDAVQTPPVEAGVLPGVTRAAAIRIARMDGLEVSETGLELEDLAAAEAIFTTNSARGLVPVRKVIGENGRPLWKKSSQLHPLFQRLRASYEALIASGGF